MIDVALFPIPNVVAFPGTVLPLHVFEPRYRRLVHDCVRDDRLVAVSHTRKTIHEPRHKETLEEAMSSNLATYQPREVFSAGRCEILKTTPDGRILVEITMSERLALVDEVQALPYRIVNCAPVEDDDESGSEADEELQKAINDKLITLVGAQNPDLAKGLEDPAWRSLPPGEYSFKIFQFLRFDAEVAQTILETRNARDRLEMIWGLLRHA